MLPAKRNKIDISKLTEDEQKLFRMYGKLPTGKNVKTMQKIDRKYFDSGDYALSKAGQVPASIVGTVIPKPDNIPHHLSTQSTACTITSGANDSPHPHSPTLPTTGTAFSGADDTPPAFAHGGGPTHMILCSQNKGDSTETTESGSESP